MANVIEKFTEYASVTLACPICAFAININFAEYIDAIFDETAIVKCVACKSEFNFVLRMRTRDAELPDAPACGGAQVDRQDNERTTDV